MNDMIEFFTCNNCAEIVGMLSNLIVITACSMRGEKYIRTVSIFGASLAAVYNLMLHSNAFFLVNCVIIIINIYHLVFLNRCK